MEEQRRALVVDDDVFTCWLLAELVASLNFEVASATTSAKALELALEFDPDLLLVDLDLGVGPTGLDVVRLIRQELPWAAAVILTGHQSPDLVAPGLSSPKVEFSYVLKSDVQSAQKLAEVVEAALEGIVTPVPAGELPTITSGQADLLRLIAAGMSNAEIARQRGAGVRSVERQIARLFQSLGLPADPAVNNRVKAAAMYLESQVRIKPQ